MADILIIDDDPSMIELVSEQIDKNFSGLRMIFASSGRRAIDILKNKTDFELIISDYNMPDGNGIDVLNYLVHSKRPIFFVLHTSILDPVLPDNVGHFFLGVIEKMDFDELNLVMTKLFLR